jgi:hypothetical protein
VKIKVFLQTRVFMYFPDFFMHIPNQPYNNYLSKIQPKISQNTVQELFTALNSPQRGPASCPLVFWLLSQIQSVANTIVGQERCWRVQFFIIMLTSQAFTCQINCS